MESLFEQIGGRDAVNAAVDIFYKRVLEDARVSPYFQGVDMEMQAGKQKAFLTVAFGGPNNYTGKNMRDAHADLVERGLTDVHFNAIAEHLQKTLEELSVPENLIGQVMTIVESVRDDVLGRVPVET